MYLFEREHEREGGRGPGERESPVDYVLSVEPIVGLDHMTLR